MTGIWFKVSPGLHDHKKARHAGKSAMGVWVLAGSWAAANTTDGFIPAAMLPRWGTRTDAKRLTEVGLWTDDWQDGEPGWRFHDWLDFNPDSYTLRLKDEADRAAGSKGNHIRWHVHRNVVDPRCEHCHINGNTPGTADSNGEEQP